MLDREPATRDEAPMKRLDWTLIRPARPDIGAKKKKLPAQIDELENAIEARVHEASRRLLSEEEVDTLVDLEERLDNLTIASCEAAHAPRVGDDADWESRIVDEFSDADTDLELDEYLEMRRQDFDCDRCPHAARFSLYPQDPCEISVGPLLQALDTDALIEAVAAPMGPDDMRTLADDLERVLDNGRFKSLAELDVAALLSEAVRFLRFWAKLGFGIRPELADEDAPVHTPEGPMGPPGAGHNSLLH